MRKKKNNKQIIEDDYSDFQIHQVYRPEEHIKKSMEFKPSKVASPFFGSKVLDRQNIIDNTGERDVDIQYDFVRKDEEKHTTKEELIEKYGTEYYEFGILSSEETRKMAGGGYEEISEKSIDEVEQRVKEEEEATKKPFTDLFASIDETANPKVNTEETEEEVEFGIDTEGQEDDYTYNSYDKNLDVPEPVSIPSFLTEEREEKQKTEVNFKFDDSLNDSELEFNDIPSMEAPEINFESNYSNPAVDRSLSVEEAMKLSQNGKAIPTEEPKTAPSPKPTPKPEAKKETVNVEINKYKNYKIPYKQFFKPSQNEVDKHPAWLEEKKNIINDTLKAFSIDGEVIDYTKGPAFTRYEIMLAPGVNVKKVNQIIDNLQMNLQVKSIRILSPIPGKNTIGIEAPNDKADVVKFGDICDDQFVNDGKPLRVALGKNIDGSNVYQDITSMPHALIAGATQSGKSVCMNTILVSLLTKNSPENLKLILVDPKKVELTFYENLPHLATPVIDDPMEAAEALKWACAEMDRRYDILARNRVRKISDYLEKRQQYPSLEPMPYIVIIVDEFNDLVMCGGQEVNDCIVRLAQKARAAGMHVILATQRPTVDVVNGTIKANIPCRIAFRVASSTDSSTILDETGAETLLGRGDMLIKNDNAPVRAQGAYISDSEIGEICDYICNKYEPDYIFTHDDLRNSMARSQSSGGLGSPKDASNEDDELLFSIAEFCVAGNSCSINAIQNNFGLGFNRAQRIVQLLEERKIVSPKQGTKPREILVDDYKLREIFGVNE